MLKVYEYAKCSTCVKALKFLDGKKVKYDKLPIVDKAPSQKELKEMLAAMKERGGSIRNLFNTSGVMYKEMKLSEKLPSMTEAEAINNTSGVMYKEMKLSEKLPSMTEAEAIKLLSENGKLVKRPFVIGDNIHLVGFKEDDWKKEF
ncbi:arsenate reductase family protein [Bdellovibrio bacteriovorus]|uniref:ArsC/Spx/MgsR family protein n=1 Tax=Bdellovibrio bacteriovorus TaxID=959 RepID=UPI0021CF5179|nr:ArsC/Spx/MgsR family protein [Bdellovibrio bacteriovorus]UXR65419.1 arsenate reductase family protein [Bdellovibrio bacteriovorus]